MPLPRGLGLNIWCGVSVLRAHGLRACLASCGADASKASLAGAPGVHTAPVKAPGVSW